ncbi:hypothetical protein ACH4Q6_25215 [Streptomyces lydicus]|uniref:hypothetical protein n=1 Tax=Streptomyces lydicus TaxID=47763 RepID=UPI0037881E2C
MARAPVPRVRSRTVEKVADKSLTAAPAEVGAMAHDGCSQRVERFREQARQVPARCLRLGLTVPERTAVTTYAEVMGFWMTATTPGRPGPALHRRARISPHTGPGYFDEVLGA